MIIEKQNSANKESLLAPKSIKIVETSILLILNIGRITKKVCHLCRRILQNLFDLCVGMILGNGGLFKVSRQCGAKFEQGYKQKEFLYHLFDLFSGYTFMCVPGERIDLRGKRKGYVKSYWFKSFSHSSFTEIWGLFYKNGKKEIFPNLIAKYLTPIGFAYWRMCDGSLQGKRLIIHTQGFTETENLLLVKELNKK